MTRGALPPFLVTACPLCGGALDAGSVFNNSALPVGPDDTRRRVSYACPTCDAGVSVVYSERRVVAARARLLDEGS